MRTLRTSRHGLGHLPIGLALANRALVATALAAYIAGVYSSLVLWAARGSGRTFMSVLATLLVAASFERVRLRAQRIANRITYGQRATPLDIVAHLAERVTRSGDAGGALSELARAVADGTGAARAVVWLLVGEDLVPAAAHPAGGPSRAMAVPVPAGGALPALPGSDAAVPIMHGGELLGALAIARRTGEAPEGLDARLLADIAPQAGLALRNVRLTAELSARVAQGEAQAAELRASRTRVVEAQDAERRRLERDIHDGAQQHLVAFAVKLRMARSLAGRDFTAGRELVAELAEVNAEALDTLRDLSRGIYPPVLAEAGLASALSLQTSRSSLPVHVEADNLARYAPDIEAAVYFACLEALQNVTKHADASRVNVRLYEEEGALRFTVADDGGGFDPGAAARGTGFANMLDRVAAAGGTLRVESAPGRGTVVTGTVPLSVTSRA